MEIVVSYVCGYGHGELGDSGRPVLLRVRSLRGLCGAVCLRKIIFAMYRLDVAVA